MTTSRELATVALAGALCLAIAACGESDVDKARNDVQDKAGELKSRD